MAEIRSHDESSHYEYQVGGSLPIAANSYVIRQADTEFYQNLQAGQFCYVLNARQMGKSSLRVRTIQRLQAAGFVCACIDLTGIGKEAVTPEKWYAGIVNALVSSCQLSDRIQWRNWWRERRDVLSPVQRLSVFIDEILLVEVSQNIIVFIDEIDRVLSQTFALDDFFALIRYFYNQRADQPAYRRLTFALLGVATPSDLMPDKTQTPFNIGQAIALSGFQRTEVRPLMVGLAGKVVDPDAAIGEILAWTGGQPFLTQKLCQIVVEVDHSCAGAGHQSVAALIAALVHTHILTNWESQDEPEHLRTIRDRILRNQPQTGQLLGLYQQILDQGEIAADGSLEQTELRLSGLVVQQQGMLRVYNPIYQRVFDRAWVANQLAKLRPYAETFNAWIASEGQDSSRLLRGQALQAALQWASHQHLSDGDYRFLAASQDLEKQAVQQALKIQAEESQILARANETLAIAQQTAETALTQAKQKAKHITVMGVAVMFAIACVMAAAIHRLTQQAQQELAEKENFLQALSANVRLESNPFAGLLQALQATYQLQRLEATGTVSPATRAQVEAALRKAVYTTQEYHQLVGHAGAIYGIGFSPDGKLLASGGEDHTIRLWHLPAGTIKMTLKGHRDQLWSVEFSPDGQWLASASRDGTVKLWRVADGQLVKTLTGHQSWVRRVRFSPQGDRLASSDSEGNIKLWQVESGSLVQTIPAHPRYWVTDIDFSPDGTRLASASSDDSVKVWQVEDGTLLHHLKGHQNDVRTVSFSPDGKRLASSGGDASIKLWDVETGAELQTWSDHRSSIWSVQFSPDGKTLASGSSDSTIKLWKLDDIADRRTESQTLRGHNGRVWSIRFSPDGQTLASAGVDQAVRLWKLAPSAPQTYAVTQGNMSTVSLSPDGQRLAAGGAEHTLVLWDLKTNRLLKTLKDHRQAIRSVRFSPDGSQLASSSSDRTIKLWNAEDGTLIKTLTDRHNAFGSIRFSFDGKKLISSNNNLVKLWNIETGIVIKTLRDNPHDRCNIATINPSPDGKMLAVGCRLDQIRLWDLTTGTQLKTLTGHSGGSSTVSFSPDGKLLASGGPDGLVKVWDVTEGTLRYRLAGHLDDVMRVTFSPNGQMLASAGRDRAIRLWDITDGKLRQILEGHQGAINSLSFNAAGNLLASASEDNTVKVWQLDLKLENLVQLNCRWLQSYLLTHPEAQDIRSVCQVIVTSPKSP